ncbi:hypothetical protein [Methylomarinum vadi]|uniref:hypothetical protein n=1 Tax=Methylomarinum vadi TaxID=438855 RepID=UPI0004DFA4CD|nr:hypothetical protein [Methylomarinum vadi]
MTKCFTAKPRPVVALCGALLAAACLADDTRHNDRTEAARRVISAEPYLSEYGVLDDPYQFKNLDTAQVRKKLQEAERGINSAQAKHYQSQSALQQYEQLLVTQRKVPRSALPTYRDPLGKLEKLRGLVDRSGKVLRDYLIAKADLSEEMALREHPDKFFAREQELQEAIRHSKEIQDYWAQLRQGMQQGDPDAWSKAMELERNARAVKIAQGKEPVIKLGKTSGVGTTPQHTDSGAQTSPGTAQSTTLISAPASGSTVDISYQDVYGAQATAEQIAQVEIQEIKKLPAELRRGVPKEIQRLFLYGGYEKLSRAEKSHIRHVVKQLNQQLSQQNQLEKAFGDIYNRAENSLIAEKLVSPNRAKRAQMFSAIGFLLIEFTQGATDYVYGQARKAKWREAYQKIAADIPAGKSEKVIFIEDVHRRQLEFYSWYETESVQAFRGTIDIDTKNDMFEALVNLRKSSQPGYWRQQRLYTAYVIGSGQGKDQQPSDKDAFMAGANIGRLARGGKDVRDILRKTYPKYNKWQSTREAFKRGYRKAAQGLID